MSSESGSDGLTKEIELTHELAVQQRQLRQDVVRTFFVMAGVVYALAGGLLTANLQLPPPLTKVQAASFLVLLVFLVGFVDVIELAFLGFHNRRLLLIQDVLRSIRMHQDAALRETVADLDILQATLHPPKLSVLLDQQFFKRSMGDRSRGYVVAIVSGFSLTLSLFGFGLVSGWGLFLALVISCVALIVANESIHWKKVHEFMESITRRRKIARASVKNPPRKRRHYRSSATPQQRGKS